MPALEIEAKPKRLSFRADASELQDEIANCRQKAFTCHSDDCEEGTFKVTIVGLDEVKGGTFRFSEDVDETLLGREISHLLWGALFSGEGGLKYKDASKCPLLTLVLKDPAAHSTSDEIHHGHAFVDLSAYFHRDAAGRKSAQSQLMSAWKSLPSKSATQAMVDETRRVEDTWTSMETCTEAEWCTLSEDKKGAMCAILDGHVEFRAPPDGTTVSPTKTADTNMREIADVSSRLNLTRATRAAKIAKSIIAGPSRGIIGRWW